MVDIKRSPPREGVRGGLEQFRWDQVKTQGYRDRECYLGHSLKIGLSGQGGRFYKHDWWTNSKKKSMQNNEDDEFKTMKLYEDELMQEALGLKPKNLLLQKGKITAEKARELLSNLKVLDTSKQDKSDFQNETEKIKRNGSSLKSLNSEDKGEKKDFKKRKKKSKKRKKNEEYSSDDSTSYNIKIFKKKDNSNDFFFSDKASKEKYKKYSNSEDVSPSSFHHKRENRNHRKGPSYHASHKRRLDTDEEGKYASLKRYRYHHHSSRKEPEQKEKKRKYT